MVYLLILIEIDDIIIKRNKIYLIMDNLFYIFYYNNYLNINFDMYLMIQIFYE